MLGERSMSPLKHGLQIEPKWRWRPMARDCATGHCAGMSQVRSVRPHNAVEPKQNTAGSAERHADVTDVAEPAIRQRDDVEECGVASFPASDPPSWWSGG
jgi:hypothetical protein